MNTAIHVSPRPRLAHALNTMARAAVPQSLLPACTGRACRVLSGKPVPANAKHAKATSHAKAARKVASRAAVRSGCEPMVVHVVPLPTSRSLRKS